MRELIRQYRQRRQPTWASKRMRHRLPGLERLECRALLAGDLAITEFMAANTKTLPDADGDWPDWVEIHNANAVAVDLTGWQLTDDTADLRKWRFPARVLQPDEYLVVFASGRDQVTAEGELHTNFKLAADGEYLALVSPVGVVVSQYDPDWRDYPPQSADVSYGLPAGGSRPGYLELATPGRPNSAQRSAPVDFEWPSGVFQGAFSLALTVETFGTTIHYTTDGSAPTEESPVYNEPIPISSTTHVQAIAVGPGIAASAPASAWYVAIDPDLRDFTSDLPIVVLENFSGDRPEENAYQFNAMAIFEPDDVSGRSSLLDTPTVETRAGLRVRGASTAGREKASYALETWDDRNDDRAMSLLGMPSDSDWILYTPYNFDRALIRNTLIYELSNQAGRYAVRTRFVELYFNMDGADVSSLDYRGVYVLMEKIKLGPDRVAIEELEPQHDQEPEITGGWLLKIDRGDPGDVGFPAAAQQILYVDPKEVEVTPVQAAWIQRYFNDMYASLTDTDPETGYARYIDVDSWIDHHILNVLPMNVDALRLSGYFFQDRGGKLEMGPIWDFDRSMESDDGRDDRPDEWSGTGDATVFFEYPWWKELFQDPNFKQKWIDRWFELRQNVLTEANIVSIIDAMAAEIAEAQVRNFERWPDSRPRTDDRSRYRTGALDGTWEGEIEQLKAWYFERLVWIDSQSPSPPTIGPDEYRLVPGQEIEISGASWPIYYTTDGSDPRLPGGSIHPAAVLIDEEIPLVFSQDVSIVARVFSEGQWSAPVEAEFRTAGRPDDASDLAVTELNYHPHDPTSSEWSINPAWTSNDFQFVELANTGDHTIDLAGVALADGVEFTFGGGETSLLAPGARILVVADEGAFAARYGIGLPVAGVFAAGRLRDSGERLTLVDRFGVVLQDFEYGDSRPWPGRADGTGSTLEMIDTGGDYGAAGNWRASSEYGGSPGLAGSGPIADIVINEVLTRGEGGQPDRIELYNRTAQDVDLSGWYVSDDNDDLWKTMIPSGTTIAAGDYLVLSAVALDFGLDGTNGDDVWLIEADATGRPVRFVDHVEFDATNLGVALGRWPNGEPEGVLFPMKSGTFAAANSGPRTGAVVISEVHYHPPSGLIMAADFANGRADDFTPVLGTWTVRDRGYEVTPGPQDDTIATISTPGPLPEDFVFTATISIQSVPGFKENGVLLFDYHSPTDFKFLSMHVSGDKWRVGQRDATGWKFLDEVTVKHVIHAETDIRLKVEIRGSAVSLWANGAYLTYDFETPLNDGCVGLGSRGGTPRFENVKLEIPGSDRLTRDFHVTDAGTFAVGLAAGIYEARVTLGDAANARDEIAVYLQGQLLDIVSTAAGEFTEVTGIAEVNAATAERLELRLVDLGGETMGAAVSALVITPTAGGNPVRFDFGEDISPLAWGYQRVTTDDTYNPEVEITATADAQSELSLDGGATYSSSVHFVRSDGTAQTITVRAVDDLVDEGPHTGTITHAISGTNNSDYRRTMRIDSVTATVMDNELPWVTVMESGGGTDIQEAGATDTYTIALDTVPAGRVEIAVAADSQSVVSLDGGTTFSSNVRFFRTDRTAQMITVRAVDDSSHEGWHTSVITHAIHSSDDPDYPTALSVADVVANVTDNDVAGVTIVESDSGTNISEAGATDTYTIALDRVPSGAVEIAVATDAQSAVSLDGGATFSSSVHFVRTDSRPQTITVRGVADLVGEGGHRSTITHSVIASGDPDYPTTLAIAPLVANVTDSEIAAVTITESHNGTTISEAGATDSYTIALARIPSLPIGYGWLPGTNVVSQDQRPPENLEFVELVGTTEERVDLEGWRLDGAVELTFAPGMTIKAGETVVAVGFDPVDSGKVAAFRAAFDVAESVVLVGPYAGQLGNGGEVVRLMSPAVVDSDAGVLVDHVEYDDQLPWPTVADGFGLSLNRVGTTAFGNFASSWSARLPTPGTAQFRLVGDVNGDGAVNVADAEPFARVLADPQAYEMAHGLPAVTAADIDGDGSVDFDDIDDFRALLAGAEPGSTDRSESGGRANNTTVAGSLRETPAGVAATTTADLAITEFMAANAATLLDRDGMTPDWIEIHNAGADPVSLAGWKLTDDPGDLDKWECPPLALDPGQYLVIFASGQDRGTDWDAPHTNFRLSAEGEYVALVSPAGVVVSEFGPDGNDYPAQFTDIAYGVPGNGGEPGYLAVPTPRAANSLKRSASVEFSRPSGVFRETFSLTLTVATIQAEIHYTTDGSEPTEESPIYTAPIEISSTTQIRAIAVGPELSTSTPANAWYVTMDADLAGVTSNLPIVVLENFANFRPPQTSYQFNAMAIFEPSAASGRTSLRDTPTVETRAGLKIRGSSTASRPKASYALEIWDDRNADTPMPLLGMPSDSDWILYGPYNFDRAMLRNPFIFELSNQVGRWAVRTRFVEVYQNISGGNVSSTDYMGVYVLMEKIKRGPDRIDIQALEPEHDQEPEISGGWILKIDRADPGDVGFSAAAQTIQYVDPKEVDVTDAQAAWIKNYFNQMHASLTDTDPETGYAQYIDVDSWIDHHILNVLPMNVDAFRLSGYFFMDRGGKLEMGPIWDFDRSIESTDTRDDSPEMWNGTGDATLFFDYPWWKELFQDPNFMQKWIDRWFELRQDVLSDANIGSTIDVLAGQIEEAQTRNFDKWRGTRPRVESPSGFDVGALDGSWEGEVAQMKAWLFTRAAWIDSQFVAPPAITPGGGRTAIGTEIVLNGGPAAVYYTMDGSDPRLPGGAISDDAMRYEEGRPLVFSEVASIVARARMGGNWSAPAEAQLLVESAADDATFLAITEINHDPHKPSDAERTIHPASDSDSFEFIELANTGDHVVDLAGVAFVAGVEFTFSADGTHWLQPGERVLVVADGGAFAARYGTGLPVAGEFTSGRLGDGGERIALVDRYGAVIQDFEYGTTDRWMSRANGAGSTLEVVDTAADYNDTENWRASSEFGGSPGWDGAGPIFDVVINEILSRGADGAPDQIELCNRTAQEVDLSGWYLSDDKDDRQKTTLPDGTTIAAGAYLVLSSAQIDFGLSGTKGDDLWLLAADARGQPVRFVDNVQFDATDVGVALGRWPDADPHGILFPMTDPSFGAANSGPRTGAVVLTELHYHPPSGPIVAEDLSDGKADDFVPVLGTWTVRDGGYEVTPGAEEDAISTIATAGPLPEDFVFTATISIRSVPGFKENGMLIFDYHSPTDFKFVSVHIGGSIWRMGQRDADGWHFLVEEEVRAELSTDRNIRAKVMIDGSSATLWASGVAISYDFGSALNDGQVGVASKDGTPRFQNLEVEWMGNPPSLEFLELVGTTEAAIDLGGWRLDDAVEWTFAQGTAIGPGEVVVVVGFDPSAVDQAAAFRALLGIDSSVTLIGPYAKKLGNDGDVVRLMKPVTSGVASPGFILVDQVAYDDQSPWPTAADGYGAALSRASMEAFGSFGSSWLALAPTAGAVPVAVTGDLNFDGNMDSGDIDSFARILADPAAYRATYGLPAAMVADADGDGDVDFDDVDDFVALLGGDVPASPAGTDSDTGVAVAVAGPRVPGAGALRGAGRKLRLSQITPLPVATSAGSWSNEWRGRSDAGPARRDLRSAGARSGMGRGDTKTGRGWDTLADCVLEAESVWLDPLAIQLGGVP